MANEGAREIVHERPRLYSCKYCDRLFTSSQALGGHMNCHRKERVAIEKAQNEAEVFPMQQPPPPPPQTMSTFLHPKMFSPQTHALLHPPSNSIPEFAQYQYNPQPYHYNNTNKHAPGIDPEFSSGASLLSSPFGYGDVLRENPYGRPSNISMNYEVEAPTWERTVAGTIEEAAAGPSSALYMSQAILNDGEDVHDNMNDKDNDIDLTLHL